ncbi:MAG: hypothetical protein JSW50_10710 [Candidatus Latescibacterota bacterium]|nr:MAG: hypothetical protein JSW50_10710 [Candidatus Latescibacterota bacterium]
MNNLTCRRAFIPLMLSLFLVIAIDPAGGPPSWAAGLNGLVTPVEKDFLLTELARVQPPERLHELSTYGQRQSELGGGFYGMLPDQLTNPDSIPLANDDAGRMAAALRLAQQRSVNLAAMQQINPNYRLTFEGESLPSLLGEIAPDWKSSSESTSGLVLVLDTSALDGFFDALADGEISSEEAVALANLSSNQSMLEHRRNLGYVPEPLPDTESLAEMIRIAGSTDPLDRLWCWINPQNAFGYADLAQNVDDYTRFLSELGVNKRHLESAVVKQIESYTPEPLPLDVRFAFTVGWAIQGWATPEMVGLNLEQAKDDWHRLFGTLVEETYHRLQLELCPTMTGKPAREFSDLVTVDTGHPGYDRLYEIITYTVLEGSANLVRGQFAAADLADKAPAGAELMTRFVEQVVQGEDVESADALISEGLKGNGPLYGLGWKLASLIAERDGKRAVGEHLRHGPVQFFNYGARLAAEQGEGLLTGEVVAVTDALEKRLAR